MSWIFHSRALLCTLLHDRLENPDAYEACEVCGWQRPPHGTLKKTTKTKTKKAGGAGRPRKNVAAVRAAAAAAAGRAGRYRWDMRRRLRRMKTGVPEETLCRPERKPRARERRRRRSSEIAKNKVALARLQTLGGLAGDGGRDGGEQGGGGGGGETS